MIFYVDQSILTLLIRMDINIFMALLAAVVSLLLFAGVMGVWNWTMLRVMQLALVGQIVLIGVSLWMHY